jgi:hypothetical protein
MIYDHFLRELSEEELGLLAIVIQDGLTFEVSYPILKTIRRDVAARKLEKLKANLTDEGAVVLENLQKKLLAPI